MKNIILYAHGGSKNHGCEAIVRSTVKVLDREDILLYTLKPDEDQKYNLDEIVNIKNEVNEIDKFNIKRIISSIKIKLFNDDTYSKRIKYDHIFKKHNNDTIAISIGGDNYCYKGFEKYSIMNENFNKNRTKTILWGCSIEPSLIEENMAKDLANYSLITTRESISYEAVKKINKNTKLIPDTAFQLDKIELPLPKNFKPNNTIGINISPLIISYEEKKGSTMENYMYLIQHIIDTTDMNIALIPHVVWENNDDREPLNEIFNKFKSTGRVVMLDDYNCMELKGFISRCRMFIGARTHATIAAYSTCVPTLVIGYSVKAKGIAKDIFGTYDNYVLPVQCLKEKDDLINAFEWMKTNEEDIRAHLQSFIPEYKKSVFKVREEVRRLVEC